MVRGWGRTEAGHPVPGLVVVLRRHGDDLSAEDWRPAASLGLPGAVAGAGVGERKPLVSRSRNSSVSNSRETALHIVETRVIQRPKFGTSNGPNFGPIPLDEGPGPNAMPTTPGESGRASWRERRGQ